MDRLLSSTDRRHLLELIETCHASAGGDDFQGTIFPKLRELLPHRMFAYGCIDGRTRRITRYVNAGFPEEYVAHIRTAQGELDCPLVRRWMGMHEPIYLTHEAASRAPLFYDYGVGNVVLHGVVDATHQTAGCYIFAGLNDRWDPRAALIIRIATPHLHAAITGSTAASAAGAARAVDGALSTREVEVLRWIAHGKSNGEIAMILGISVCTVQIHVQNVIRKLNAANRAHAVARGYLGGILRP